MAIFSALRISVCALLCAFIVAHPTSRTYYALHSVAPSSPQPQSAPCTEPRVRPTSKPTAQHPAPSASYNAPQTSSTGSMPSANYAPSNAMPGSKLTTAPVQQASPTHAQSWNTAPAQAPAHSKNHGSTTSSPSATENARNALPGSSIELEQVSASATGNNSMSVGAEKDRAAAAGNAVDGNVLMAAAAPGQAMGIIVPSTPMF